MKLKLASLAAAGAAVGFLTFSGIAMAGAQDASTSSTTTPAATAPSTANAPQDHGMAGGCPGMGDDGGTSSSSSSTTAPSSGTTPGT